MIETVAYFATGFVVSLMIIIIISYYDEGDNDYETYLGVGLFGVMVAVLWPLAGPFFVFVIVAGRVSEEWGRSG